MKKWTLSFLVLLLPVVSLCQIKLTEGYIIDWTSKKKSCFLLNQGLEGKGEHYLYALERGGETMKVDVSEIKEFGIENSFRYISENITLDISSDHINSLKDTIDHERIEKGHAFLKVLIDSPEASLYQFLYEGKKFFFFRLRNSNVIPLLYKKYTVTLANQTTEALYDNRFKEQLAKALPCSYSTTKVSYTHNSLIKYFERYLSENEATAIIQSQKMKGVFLFKGAAAYNSTSFYIADGAISSLDMGSDNNFSYGAELEYLFSFNRNKLGLFIEGSLHETSFSITEINGNTSTLDYQYIEVPFGISYRFYLNPTIAVYFKSAIVPSINNSKSHVTFYREENLEDISSPVNAMFGAGIAFNRLHLETRIYTTRNITQNLHLRGSEFEQFAFRLSYSFLKL